MFDAKDGRLVVVEFAGMPGAGKTRTIDTLDHYFRRGGHRVRVLAEGARSCPLNQSERVEFASWTANRIINLLLEEVKCDRSHDLILIDRGIFDAQVFMRLLSRERKVKGLEHAKTLFEYVGLPFWNNLVNLVLLLDISADESWNRYEISHLTKAPGPIMNRKTLNLLHESYEDTEKIYATTFGKSRILRHWSQVKRLKSFSVETVAPLQPTRQSIYWRYEP